MRWNLRRDREACGHFMRLSLDTFVKIFTKLASQLLLSLMEQNVTSFSNLGGGLRENNVCVWQELSKLTLRAELLILVT